ncbi:MAG: hypothetical protein KC502_21940 [Myxococcales bacterium]|nr:hypothetical protein [Myxococcales bacterium]
MTSRHHLLSCLGSLRLPASSPLRLSVLGLLVLGLAVVLPEGSYASKGPARVRLPQVRINQIDASAWPKVRVLATIIGRGTRPIKLDAIRKLEIRSGTSTAGPPLVVFKEGKLLKNKDPEAPQAKEGKLWVSSKAGVATSAVIVVAGHEHPALKRGSLGPQLREAVGLLLKQFGKNDRVNVLWYSDRIRGAVGLRSYTGELQDLESPTIATKCAQARAAALSGEDITLGPKGKDIAAGTDLCGLQGDAGALAKIVSDRAMTSFRGKFPRLFNLGKSFYDPTRYCDIPTDRLEGFGDGSLMPKNLKRTLQDREDRADNGEKLDFRTSAMDEALRILLREGRPGEQKALILISDGHDGYLDDIELCKRRPPRRCRQVKGKKRRKCVKKALDRRITVEQSMFRAKATKWLGLARSAEIKIFSLGIGSLARRDELQRLRLLAERTGGTYRSARSEALLAQKIGDLGNELLGQVVIDFTHPVPDEVEESLALRIKVRGATEKGKKIRESSKVMKVPVTEAKTIKQTVIDGVTDILVSAQEALGYQVYVYVGIAVLVIVGLITLLLLFFITRFFFRLLGRLFGRGGDE